MTRWLFCCITNHLSTYLGGVLGSLINRLLNEKLVGSLLDGVLGSVRNVRPKGFCTTESSLSTRFIVVVFCFVLFCFVLAQIMHRK